MGYDRARDLETFEINLEHRPGLTMRVRRPGFSGERAVRKAWPVLTDPSAGRDRQEPALTLAAGALAGALIDWTLQWDGVPVPCTPRALTDLDTEFLLELVTVWVERVALRPSAMGEVPDEPGEELADDNNDGDESAVDEEWLSQLPTVPLSAPLPEASPGQLDTILDEVLPDTALDREVTADA